MSKDLKPTGDTELIRPEDSVESWDEFKVVSADINYEYWTPKLGSDAVRIGVYKGLHDRPVPDFNNPEETKLLQCAVFYDLVDDRVFMNGSAILVRVVNRLSADTVVRIEYRGKVTAKNGNQCDDWKVNVLERESK